MAQIKSYVDLAGYDEMTAFASVDAERLIRSFVVTEESGVLAAQILGDLLAPRGTAPVVQILSGGRGSGKSHLLAYLRAVISQRPPASAPSHPALSDALRRLTGKTLIPVVLNFAAGDTTPFEAVLRTALDNVLAENPAMDDEQWQKAVVQGRFFEQLLSLLPVEAQLIVMIDQLSLRWEAAPELLAEDLNWLGRIAEQAESLPLRALLALDARDVQTRLSGYGFPDKQMPSCAVRELPAELLRSVITRGILTRKPEAAEKLAGLYENICERLPNFAWSRSDFIAQYPVHPGVETIAPFIRAHTRSFSLPGFAASATARALNRPELSLITVEEVFERYEYELRKDESIAGLFAFYDRVNAEALTALSGEDRLWAKMLVRALVLFLLTEEKVGLRTLADATLLFEGRDQSENGYERAARILANFDLFIPDSITLDRAGLERTWQFHPAPPVLPLRAKLAAAADRISPQDARLGTLLLTIGCRLLDGRNFDDLETAPGSLALRGGACALPPESAFREIRWRGTLRRGRICLTAEEAETSVRSQARPHGDELLNLQQIDEGELPAAAEEWRLLIVPCHSKINPDIPVSHLQGLRLHPGEILDEAMLHPLQLLLALHECQAAEAEVGEVARIARELYHQIGLLFVDLYIERGIFVDRNGPREMRRGLKTNFSELLNHEIRAALDHAYPDHPHFAEILTSEHVTALLTSLFASSSAGSDLVRDLAATFAAPLGLVSESRGKYRLNVFNEAANLPPFIHALVTLVEIHADAEGCADVPLHRVIRLLSAPPYGLPVAAHHLILVAFISSGVYELVDETTGKRLTKANLHLGFDPTRFTTLRRVATTDYPLEILHTWSKCLTGRADLPAPLSPDARQTLRDVMAEWLDHWRNQNLSERFENMPTDMMTMATWHTVSISIRRYERVALIIDNIVEETLSIETGFSRVLDLFGLDIAAFEQTRLKMQSLGDFLDWMPTFIVIRNYMLAAESTGVERIDREWEQLHSWLREPHELLMAEARLQIEQSFESFRESYSAFYAAAHDECVGYAAWQEMTGNFYASAEWQHFKLLMQFKLDGRAYESDAGMLTELVDKTRCDLPIHDILQRHPHCGCSFRLNRRLNLSSVLDAFRSLTKAASTFYSEELRTRREQLRAALQTCTDEALAVSVNAFLSACSEGRTEGLTPEIVNYLNEHLPDFPLVARLPEMPCFDDGSFTREQLRDNFNRWIDSLPEEDGLRFRVERA